MREVWRRVILVGAFLAACWCFFYLPPLVWEVRRVDFADRHQDKNAPPWALVGAMEMGREFIRRETAFLPLTEFIARETKDRLLKVSGPEWKDLVAGLARTSVKSLFYPLDQSLLRPWLGRAASFTYLELPYDNYIKYFSLNQVKGTEAGRKDPPAPESLAHPWRQMSYILAGLGLLAYVVLPWPRRGRDVVTYSRVRAVVLPDLMGVVLITVFTGLAAMLMNEFIYGNPDLLSASVGDLIQAWLVFLGVWLCLFAPALSILVVAAWYSGLEYHLLPDRIRKVTLRGSQEYFYSDMVSAGPIEWRLPRWLRIIITILFILAPRAGSAIHIRNINAANYGLGVDCRGGRQLKMWLSGLKEPERIFKALEEHGVRIDLPKDEEEDDKKDEESQEE